MARRKVSNASVSKVRLGPFTGGMNNRSEPEALEDDELVDVVNFELSADGSLQSRPPIVEEPGETRDTEIVALGYYITGGDVTYLVCVFENRTWLYSPDTFAYLEIWDQPASGFTQYDDKAVICSRNGAGGYWVNGTFTPTPQMPRGEDIAFYQERFWIYGAQGTQDENKVSFSKLNVISPASSIWEWGPLDYFTVNQGDGQWITGILPTSSRIFIFRTMSTYVFDYGSSPLNGELRQVSGTVGADTRWCIAPYQNYYLVLSAGVLYLFMNSQYYAQNLEKIRFVPRAVGGGLRIDRAVSVFGERAIVWWKGSTYVFHLQQRTWSRWESPYTEAARFFTLPWTSTSSNGAVALAVSGSRSGTAQRIYRVSEDISSIGSGEPIACTVLTKTYTFDEELAFKKMLWWGVEARTATGISGTAIVGRLAAGSVTWDELEAYSWDELEKGTWDNPLLPAAEYEDSVRFPAAAPIVMVFRLRQALRFLRIQYLLSIEIDGLAGTSPARINAIIPVLRGGGGVPGEAN